MVSDALSRRYALLSILNFRLLGSELIKAYYKEDVDFEPITKECSKGSIRTYVLQDGFLLKGNRLCIPSGFI